MQRTKIKLVRGYGVVGMERTAIFFFVFLQPHLQHMDIPGWARGQIRATAVPYAAACSNTGSLTYQGRAGIEPESSETTLGP